VGLDYYRYSRFRGTGSGSSLDSGLTAAGVTGVWTAGLARDLEVELRLPFESVRANQPEACATQARPADWCAPTASVGDLWGDVKWRMVDELYGSPVSWSVSGAFRSGEAYAGKRGRLTTLGDGQTDLGVGTSVGRTGPAGRGWYTASTEIWYFYRFANGIVDGRKAPADEVALNLEALWAFHPRVAVGPAAYGFARTGGIALQDIDFLDPNGFSALRASQLKVGGKVALFSTEGGPTVVVTVLGTAYARNNPSDTLSISFGLGWFVPRKIKLPPTSG
jgi:hypothetical protein